MDSHEALGWNDYDSSVPTLIAAFHRSAAGAVFQEWHVFFGTGCFIAVDAAEFGDISAAVRTGQ